MKHRMRLIIAAAALALVAAGCGGGDGASEGEGGTLRYAYWGPNQTQAMEKIAAEFEKENPGVDVQLELTPFKQYFTKLQTATTGGQAPDVFWINAPNFPQYAANDKLLSQNDLNIDAGKYPKAVVDLYKWDGEQVAYPKDFDTIGLWYNKALFAAKGVAVPTKDWTWDDVVTAAQKLTDPAKGVYGIAAKLDPQIWLYNVVPQGGGEVINADHNKSSYGSEGSIRALQWSADLINKHKVSPNLGQMTETDPRQMFQSGKVAMIFEGSFAAVELHKNPYTRKNADVTTLPAGPAGEHSVIHGVGQAISADTKHEDEAKKFVEFMVGERAATIQGETGVTLPGLASGQQLWLKSMPEFNLQAFIDMIPTTYSYPTSLNAPEWGELQINMLKDVWTGARPAAQVAPELEQAMNEVLAKEKR